VDLHDSDLVRFSGNVGQSPSLTLNAHICTGERLIPEFGDCRTFAANVRESVDSPIGRDGMETNSRKQGRLGETTGVGTDVRASDIGTIAWTDTVVKANVDGGNHGRKDRDSLDKMHVD
jgi:hypothetical protein